MKTLAVLAFIAMPLMTMAQSHMTSFSNDESESLNAIVKTIERVGSKHYEAEDNSKPELKMPKMQEPIESIMATIEKTGKKENNEVFDEVAYDLARQEALINHALETKLEFIQSITDKINDEQRIKMMIAQAEMDANISLQYARINANSRYVNRKNREIAKNRTNNSTIFTASLEISNKKGISLTFEKQ